MVSGSCKSEVKLRVRCSVAEWNVEISTDARNNSSRATWGGRCLRRFLRTMKRPKHKALLRVMCHTNDSSLTFGDRP